MNTKKLLLIGMASLMLLGCSTANKESSVTSSVNQNTLPEGLRYLEFENEDTGDVYHGFVNENDQPEGYGVMFYGTGDMYEGNFEEGKRSGTGTMTYATACVYIGEWYDDFMHGSGYMSWPMGDYFYGQWNWGQPFYGTKYFLQPDAPIDGSVEQRYCIYHGSFDENGLLSGYGSMSWPAGDFYIGSWKDNMRHGHGTQYWPSEDPNIPEYSFVGEFSKDHGGWIYGEGTMYYRDGRVVKGVWDGTNKIG